MKKILKLSTLFALIATIVFSFAACAGGGVGGGGTSSKNLFRIGIEERADENEMMTSLIAGFKKENPDVTIEMKTEVYSGNYSDKLISQASAGALPDLFFTLDTLVGYFASKKITVDLSDYFQTYGFSTDLIYEEVAQVGKVGEEIHMLGREYSQVVVYYNKAIFDAAGQSYPTESWTWNDMISAARQLVQKDGNVVTRAGIDMRLNWPVTMLQYFTGKNGTILNAEGSAGSINAEARSAYTELRDLVKEGVILDTFGNTGLSFMSSNVGMYFGVRSDAPTVNKSLAEWDVVHVPDMDNHVVSLGASGYSVSALSPHKELAIRFLFYIMSESGQTILAKSGNVVPALKSLADSADWTSQPKSGINYQAFLQEEGVTKVYPVSYYLKDASKTNKLTDALNKLVTSPILSTTGTIPDSTWTSYETQLTNALR